MTETEQAAAAQLERLHGGGELHAAVLALLLPRGSKRALRAWQAECVGFEQAEQIREWVGQLPGAARLPWLEVLVSRMRAQPAAFVQSFLAATRRVMQARGVQRPIDRLHWLAMRQRLGENSAASERAAAMTGLSQLSEDAVQAIACYTAFLARMIPVEPADAEDTAARAAGLAWYTSAMAPWARVGAVPPWEAPDTQALVHALQSLQAMPWMQRPTLVREWVNVATQHSAGGSLTDTAADALRLSCALLESPLPPDLARHYAEAEPFATA